jgi:hypothetical protein
MADPAVNTATSLKILRQTYTKQVFNTAIPRNVDIRDAHFTRNICTSITNELKGASLYFTRERQEKQQTQKPPVAMPNLPQDVPVPVPLYPLDVLSDNDNIRYLEDQYRNLKQIAEDERSQGLPGSMSRMVREAIGHYLTQRRK